MNSKVLFSQLFVLKNRLSKKQRLIIRSAVAAIIIFLIFLSVYTAEKNINNRYEVLFGSLASADAAKVIEELEKKSISYELLDNNIKKFLEIFYIKSALQLLLWEL
jgi:flagellar biosynthesis/type III secretory pathway M-ring protein FliF/YscJ